MALSRFILGLSVCQQWLPYFYRMCGVLLLGAALGKSVSPNAFELMSDEARFNTVTRVGLTYIEVIIGGVLVSHMQANVFRWVAVLLFASFAVYSIGSLWRGEQTCRCLGEIPQPLERMLAVNFIAITGLLAYRPKNAAVTTRQCVVFAMITVLTGSACLGMQSFALHSWRDSAEFAVEIPLSRTLDDRVRGKTISEILQLSPSTESLALQTGRWAVLVHSPRCKVCKDILKQLQTAPRVLGLKNETRIALAELPTDGIVHSTPSATVVSFSLRPDVRWLVTPPLLLITEGGIITELKTP